jgi:hypothetical protein
LQQLLSVASADGTHADWNKAVVVLRVRNRSASSDAYQTSNLMASVEKVWVALYPIEQHRIMILIVSKVMMAPSFNDFCIDLPSAWRISTDTSK